MFVISWKLQNFVRRIHGASYQTTSCGRLIAANCDGLEPLYWYCTEQRQENKTIRNKGKNNLESKRKRIVNQVEFQTKTKRA